MRLCFRIWFFILPAVGFGHCSFAQPDEITILEKQLAKSNSDTQKIQLYSELHWLYLFENPAKAKELAEKEIRLAQGKGLKKELAQGYNDLGLSHNTESEFASALVCHRRALAIRQEIKDEAGIATSWSKIGVCFTELAQYPDALDAQLKARQGFINTGNEAALAQTLTNICGILHWLKDFGTNESDRTRGTSTRPKNKESFGRSHSKRVHGDGVWL